MALATLNCHLSTQSTRERETHNICNKQMISSKIVHAKFLVMLLFNLKKNKVKKKNQLILLICYIDTFRTLILNNVILVGQNDTNVCQELERSLNIDHISHELSKYLDLNPSVLNG